MSSKTIQEVSTLLRSNSRPKLRQPQNVLLLGVGFSLRRLTSDKNFWNSLVFKLADQIEQVVVVSINTSPEVCQKQGNIHVYNFPPLFARRQKRNDLKDPYLYRHSFWRGSLEKSLTLLKLVPLLSVLVRRHKVKVVHLMDSFGFMNWVLKFVFPHLSVGLTLVTYNVHGLSEKTYALYQKTALANLDFLVATSQTSQTKIIENRIKTSGVSLIRCGIDNGSFQSRPEIASQRVSQKSRLKNCLWTGFIQQIREDSFWFTYRLARSLTEQNPKIRFWFAFKPECMKEEFALSGPNIKVFSTTAEEFGRILGKTQLLVSPILNYRSVCAPPLSWIECLGRGIPIVSTPAPGVEELLTVHQAGLVATTEEEFVRQISTLLEDRKIYRTLSNNALRLAREELAIDKIAGQYVKLWENGNGLSG